MPPDEIVGTETTANALVHSIGDAARLTGVSRSLLRLWEREGLITPGRTAGGHRLYTSDDLHRLRQIARLRRMDNLNLAAIRRELGVGGTAVNHDANADLGEMGQRLRATRTHLGMSLAEVARHSGLSISFLSAVERGQSSISVGNLFKLADAYGTTVPALGSTQQGSQRNVLHPHERARYSAGGGRVLIEDLIATPGALEAQHMEIQPGGSSEEAYAHPGEEMIYILSGTLSFVIDERDMYYLGAGDTLYFQSTQLHRWSNDGQEPVNLIWINVPLVERSDLGRRRHGAARRPGKATRQPGTLSESGHKNG